MTELVVQGLNVSFGSVRAVRDVSFRVGPGECLALIGESGSGKSVTARSLIGLTGPGSTVDVQRLGFDGLDLTAYREKDWRSVRGRRIALVLQDALVAFDPLRRAGAEIAETLRTHAVVDRADVTGRVHSLLADVGVPDPARRARQYPHELSGGLRQRALIASAIAAGPDLLLADEPTTALDATVQAQVLDLLGDLHRAGMSMLLISHDLAVVARLAERVAVMYGGRIVERGPVRDILDQPRHPYTRALLAAIPTGRSRGTRLSVGVTAGPPAGPDGCPFAARCPHADDRCRAEFPEPTTVDDGHQVHCWYPETGPVTRPAGAASPATRADGRVVIEAEGLVKRFRGPDGTWHDAVRDVSFQLRAGETLGVVGESGSGKTTVARMVLGLTRPDAGTVRLDGRPWSELRERDRRPDRRRIQPVSQDTLGTFDPRLTVARVLDQAVGQAGVPRAGRPARIADLLDQVGLATAVLGQRPLELSGGQRQRVAIARALAPAPEVIVCDEPVSALDVSIQAQILDLLAGLRHDLGVAMLFISHDLGVIHHLSDRILVMKDGRVVETGPADRVFAAPSAPYTRQLLAATAMRPDLDPSPAVSLPG